MLLYIPELPARTDASADTAVPAVKVTAENSVPADSEVRADDKKTAPAGKARAAKQKKYRKYNVKWYETLDDVAVKFNVTTEAIIALNGQCGKDTGRRRARDRPGGADRTPC